MPCDSRLKRNQTIQQRADEVRKVLEKVNAKIASRQVRVKVGPQGGVAFIGLTEEERDGVTDACIYRRIMSTGSALAKAAIANAEMVAGRYVDAKAVATGTHSHDGGKSWHNGH
jgi:hypothetical protein